jgi:tetratricopeptide (TPR) repeat protein
LFKHQRNIFRGFAILVFLNFAIACKSKREAVAAGEHSSGEKSQSRATNDIRFAAMFVDGCAARMKGNLDEARKLFIECNKIDPSNVAVKYELAMIYKLLGANEQALAFAKASAAAEPKNEWYQLLLIECYNTLKQYSQSVKVREALVKNFPSRAEFKEDLAFEYHILGQYDKAYGIYDELERTYGINEQLTLNKIKLLKSQNKFKEAEAELLRLSESNLSETRFYGYLADFYMERNALTKAKEMYDKIVTIEPNNPVVNLALHDFYSAQGKSGLAFEHLKKAFLNPDLDVMTKGNIVVSFYEKRNDAEYREKGMNLAEIMVQVHPEAPESNGIYADYLMLSGKTREAAGYLYKAVRKEKSNFRVWEQLLLVYHRLEQFDSLERHSSQAMEFFPTSPVMYYYNGIANIHQGNYRKAIRSLKDGLEFVVDNKLLMIDFYFHLGDAYYYNEEFEKCYKAFEDALKVDSDNTAVLNQYAYYLALKKEQLDKAEKFSRKSNELQPENRAYMDTYGWILFQQKRYAEAEQWLGRASRIGAPNPVILEHYGDVLFKLNKTDEALRQWENARRAGGNSEALQKKIREKKLNDQANQ